MQKVKKINLACITIVSNSGMTFIELLLGLFIFSTLIMFLPPIYRLTNVDDFNQQLAVDQFFNFVTDEIRINKLIALDEASIELANEQDDKIKISQYNQLIRRQVNGSGHEVLLRDVADFRIISLSSGLKLKIRTLTGDLYEKIIVYY